MSVQYIFSIAGVFTVAHMYLDHDGEYWTFLMWPISQPQIDLQIIPKKPHQQLRNVDKVEYC